MNNLINHVTPETADRLKAAGFPQPSPEVGQVWYDPKNKPCFVFTSHDNTWSYAIDSSGGTFGVNGNDHGLNFAPTATDIIRELSHENIKISFYENDGFNVELNYDSFYGADKTFEHKNPAEAAGRLVEKQIESLLEKNALKKRKF